MRVWSVAFCVFVVLQIEFITPNFQLITIKSVDGHGTVPTSTKGSILCVCVYSCNPSWGEPQHYKKWVRTLKSVVFLMLVSFGVVWPDDLVPLKAASKSNSDWFVEYQTGYPLNHLSTFMNPPPTPSHPTLPTLISLFALAITNWGSHYDPELKCC